MSTRPEVLRRNGLARRRRHGARLNLEALERRELLAVWTVISNTDTGTGSIADPSKGDLRYCLTQANADPTNPVINFSIAGNATIQLTGPLPSIAKPMTINATTQTGYAGAPLVEIDGTQITAAQSSLTITATAGGTTIKGLAFDNSKGTGLTIQGDGAGGGDGNMVAGCYFGTADGVTAKPNLVGLAILGSSSNLIGGAAAGAGNLISGNTQAGITLGGAAVANNNLIVDNLIGLNAAGTGALANGVGITVNRAAGTLIQGNTISGNTGDGVWIQSVNDTPRSTTLVGNGVGVDKTLAVAVPNGGNGVHVSGSVGVKLGGTAAGSINVISGNKLSGVLIDPAAGGAISTTILIQGNRIGTNAGGSAAVPNLVDGVKTVGAQAVTIGGTTVAARNIISGNAQAGIELANITFGANTTDTVIQGNYIGTNVGGTNLLANGVGIFQNGGDNTTIGGTAAGAGNLISGNTNEGIKLGTGDHSVVQGNVIGVDSTLSQPLGNKTGVLFAGASYALIGGSAAGAGNIISGNGAGIDCFVIGSQNETIQGNWIGVLPGASPTSPVTPLGNSGHGVRIAGPINVLIGGPNPGEGNVIAANGTGSLGGDGIITFGTTTGLKVQGNWIGTDSLGTPGLGNVNNGVNGGNGVELFSSDNTIGGVNPGEGNVIANNSVNGIVLVLTSHHNSFLGNSIYGNGLQPGGGARLGINFGTGNEPASNVGWPPGPTGSGPNDLQNYPALDPTSGVYNAGTIEIKGTLNANVGQTYRVEFFASPTQNSSGHGEGKIFLGSTNVSITDNVTYRASFDATLSTATPIPAGTFITATATDPLGNTSEFAQNITSKQIVDVSTSGSVVSDFPSDPTKVIVGGVLTYTFSIANSSLVAANAATFTDALGPNVTYLSSTADVAGVTPSYSAGVVTAVFPSIGAGQTVHVTVTVRVNASAAVPSPAPIVNNYSVATADANTSPNPSGTVSTTNVLPAADLAVVSVTATPDGVSTPLYAGAAFTYSITVTNVAGRSEATNVVVTDYLPDSSLVAFDPALNPGWTADDPGNPHYATYNLGTMAPGATLTLTLKLTTKAAAVAASPNNFATIFSTAAGPTAAVFDPVLPNNTSATLVTPVTASAAVQVAVAPDPSTVHAGEDLSYTIRVNNTGPSPASGVVLTDTIPAGTTFVSAVQGGLPLNIVPDANGKLTIPLGAIASGASIAPITITVGTAGLTSSSAVSPTTTANLAWNEFPRTATAANVVVGTVTPKSLLAIGLQGSPASIYVGDAATYTVSVRNNGPSDDTNVQAVVALPAASVVALSPGSYTVVQTPNSQILTFNLGTIPAGGALSSTIQFKALAPAAAPLGTGVVNVGATVSGTNDPSPDYPPATARTTVLASTDLSVSLSPSAQYSQIGQPLVYTITATNSGPSPASGVVVTNTLPAMPFVVEFVGATRDGAPINVAPDAHGVVTLPVGTLAAGQSTVFTITATTTNSAVAASPILDTATISGAERDPDPTNNTKSVDVTVTPAVYLTTTMAVSPDTVEVGDDAVFTAAVANYFGPSDATNVTLSATIPANSTLVWVSPGVTVVNNQLIRNVGRLSIGAAAWFQYVVSPTASAVASGELTSSANAQATETLVDPSAATTSATTHVIEGRGVVQFATGFYTVDQNVGSVAIVVDRVGGSRGTLTVDYKTESFNATPGFDYTPVSGTLTFAQGVTSQTIIVPILANPYSSGDEVFKLDLSNATPSPSRLGAPATAWVTIVNPHPNTTPLLAGWEWWDGAATTISAIHVPFNQPLTPASALNPANFQLVGYGPDGRFGTADDQRIGLTPTYDPSTFTVTLTPWAPIGGNTFYHLTLVGGEGGLTNLGGTPLSGDGANPGTNGSSSLGRGTSLRYYEPDGDLVALSVSGGGFIDDSLDSSGTGRRFILVGAVPRRTTLTGTVARSRTGDGRAYLGYTVYGLGNFGDVRVNMYSPPFLVDRFPFSPASPSATARGARPTSLGGQAPAPSRPAPAPRVAPTPRAAQAPRPALMRRPFLAARP